MRVAARKFAVALWIGATFVAVDLAFTLSRTAKAIPNSTSDMVLQYLIFGGIALITLRAGGLVVLGAIIWLLGDIRDRLAPQQD